MEPKKKTPFKRNYVACLNCRTRKVKCDLGSVENPNDPPCARCKRERKECVFVESKRGLNRIKAHTSYLLSNSNSNTNPTSNLNSYQNQNHQNPSPNSNLKIQHETQEIQINPILPLPSPYFHSKNIELNNNSVSSVSSYNSFQSNSLYSSASSLKLTSNSNYAQNSNNNNTNNNNNNNNVNNQRFERQESVDSSENSTKSLDENNYDTQNSVNPLDPSANSNLPSVNSSIQSLTNNATMIYLAHVAGKVAYPDSRDRINGAERLSQLERSVPIPRSLSSSNTNGLEDSPSVTSYFDAKNSPFKSSNNNSISNLNSPATNLKDTEPIKDSFGHGNFIKNNNSLYPILQQDRFTVPPLTTSQSMRQRPSTKLIDIEYIVSSNDSDEIKSQYILTDIEARRLIKLFFITMHPFYPYISPELRDPDLLASYPILLCALLAISSRYNSLPDKIGDWDNINDNNDPNSNNNNNNNNYNTAYNSGDRHLAVHEQLWIYCQRLMSMTVWGESSSRSVGTLLTFLLFTEWNPRAIHFRWGDYANSSNDDSLANKKIIKNKNVGKDIKNKSNSNNNKNFKKKDDKTNNEQKEITKEEDGEEEYGRGHRDGNGDGNGDGDRDRDREEEEENEEEFAGLSAMKRSEIMSFMLIGTATRLSFLLETDPLIFIATHISEIQIAVGLNKKSMLQQTLSEVDVNEPSFQFTPYQKANIELLQFFSLCYETLYGTRPKFISLDKYQTLAILDILSPILENWYRKYYKLLKPSNIHCAPLASCNDDGSPDWLHLISMNPKLERDLLVSIERESLISDYYYTKLYLYSLALSGDTSVNANLRNSKKGRNLRLDELARYSRYVELAYKAAKEVLAVIQRVRKLRLIKYMPVRWVTRVIKSVSFIVKCYLTLTTDIHTNPLSDGKSNSSFKNLNKESGIFENNGKQQNTNGEILKLSVIPLEEIITLLQKTAICLRYAAPDELHLCTRYSTILMYLCSQFKTQMRERNDKLKNGIREYEKDDEFNHDEEENPVDVEYFEQQQPLQQPESMPQQPLSMPQQQQQQQQQQLSQNQNFQQHHDQRSPPQQQQQHASHIEPQQQNQMLNQHFNNQTFINNQTCNNTVYGTNINRPEPMMPPQSFENNGYHNLDVNNETIDFSNANQELFDDFFNKNPSETLFNFFSTDNNPGLDFVDQFTKEMERDFLSKGGKH